MTLGRLLHFSGPHLPHPKRTFESGELHEALAALPCYDSPLSDRHFHQALQDRERLHSHFPASHLKVTQFPLVVEPKCFLLRWKLAACMWEIAGPCTEHGRLLTLMPSPQSLPQTQSAMIIQWLILKNSILSRQLVRKRRN